MKQIMLRLGVAFGAGLLGLTAQAAPGSASEEQVNAVNAGQSREEVIQSLGQPAQSPHWAGGVESLVYTVADADDATTRAYIDIGPDNTVKTVTFSNDGGAAGDAQ